MNKFSKLLPIAGIVLFVLIGAAMSNSNENQDVDIAELNGIYLKVWNICYADFISIDDMSEDEKDLQNYTVKFQEGSSNYIIWLIPKLLSERKMKLINRMVLGRETKYLIDKQNLNISNRIFYKS